MVDVLIKMTHLKMSRRLNWHMISSIFGKLGTLTKESLLGYKIDLRVLVD